jgi:hypothetical protein
MIADRFTYDIGSKINDTSSAAGRSATIYGFNRGFFVFISRLLQDQINWHAHEPKGKIFGPALKLSKSSRPRVFASTHSHPLNKGPTLIPNDNNLTQVGLPEARGVKVARTPTVLRHTHSGKGSISLKD